LRLRLKLCCLNLVSFNSLQIFSSIEVGDDTLAPLTGPEGRLLKKLVRVKRQVVVNWLINFCANHNPY
jgi:hypothetical protein